MQRACYLNSAAFMHAHDMEALEVCHITWSRPQVKAACTRACRMQRVLMSCRKRAMRSAVGLLVG